MKKICLELLVVYGLGAMLSFLLWASLGTIIGGSYWWYALALLGYSTLNAWVDANAKVAKTLGRKKKARVIAHQRTIPVGNRFESAIPNHVEDEGVRMFDGFHLVTEDGDTVHWSDIQSFVRKAQIRQDRGKSPFSRTFFTRELRPRLPISHYNAIVDLMVESGYIVDRRSGKSGRLLTNSEAIINMMAKQIGVRYGK